MPQNFPYNGQQYSNDIAITDTYPKMQWAGTEANAVYFEDVEIAGVMYQKVQNAAYIKWSGNWILVNPNAPAYAITLQNGTMQLLTSPANASPFTAWQVVGNIVGKPQVAGIQTAVPADGSASFPVNLPTAFLNATNEVFLSIGSNYTGTDNAILAARLVGTPTKSQFNAIVAGGQSGTTVDLHFLAFGS